MHISSIVNVYAQTLYDAGVGEQVLDQLYRDICTLLYVYKHGDGFSCFINNPTLTKASKKGLIVKYLKPYIHDCTLRFLLFVMQKERYSYLKSIFDAFIGKYKQMHDVEVVEVHTAVALSEEMRREVMGLASRLAGHKKIELSTHIDSSLVGGYVLKVGDRQIDASLSSQFKRLKLLLQS